MLEDVSPTDEDLNESEEDVEQNHERTKVCCSVMGPSSTVDCAAYIYSKFDS